MRQEKDSPLAEIERGIAENADPATLFRQLTDAESKGFFGIPLPAAVLRAKAVLQNRLGLPENAILHLAEARQHDHDAGAKDAWKTSRELATIYAWRGDVDRANTELIRAMVEALSHDREDMLPLFLADAGRVCLERGDPETGALCFAAALKGMVPGDREQVRAAIGHIQCLNMTGQFSAAGDAIDALSPHMDGHNDRFNLLLAMERARQNRGADDSAGVAAALAEAGPFLPEDPGAWEHVEFALVRFEVEQAACSSEMDTDALEDVIARLEEDQLHIQEALMRLVLVEALKARTAVEEAIAQAAQALALGIRLSNRRVAYKARTALIDLSAAAHLDDDEGSAALPLSARYVRASRIGQGGYGSVYRAVDTETGRKVAVKIISLKSIADPAERERRLADVRGELAMSRSVRSPHVARVLETFASDGDLVMVQDLISGGELDADLIASRSAQDITTLLSQAAFGLAALHEAGVVHRDVKPQNVLVRRDGTPVIVDFGLAGVAGESEGETLRGTRDYMAPELLRAGNARVYNKSADAYAFGIMLRWALGLEDSAGGWFSKGPKPGTVEAIADALTQADPDKRLNDLADAGRQLAALAQQDV